MGPALWPGSLKYVQNILAFSRTDQFLYRTVLPSDYQALSTPQPVTGTLVVEASAWLADNQWIARRRVMELDSVFMLARWVVRCIAWR